ncbi:MAG TPA: septal ring lytic transglycosylase RlpA family protein [Pseudolabrys sp.]|nr:septal ring lytic transglycosylase RlpA family protein [Pseudolabrys sp.]
MTVLMAPIASELSSKLLRISLACGSSVSTFLLAGTIFFAALCSTVEISIAALTSSVIQPSSKSEIGLHFANSEASTDDVVLVLILAIDDADVERRCELKSLASLSPLQEQLPPVRVPQLIAPSQGPMLHTDNPLNTRGVDDAPVLAYVREKARSPGFAVRYRALTGIAALIRLPRIELEAARARATIVGTVSTYNPYRDGKEEGGPETASGEIYDASGWTGAIQTRLRDLFGGVRYGKLYQPAFALVESGEKQAIIKINDVGPLRPGRVLDLSERSMRFFDPFLTRGLLKEVKITILPGETWTPGPVGEAYLIGLAGQSRSKSANARDWQKEIELAHLRAKTAQSVPSPHVRTGRGRDRNLVTADSRS